MNTMGPLKSTEIPLSFRAQALRVEPLRPARRRHITPQAGCALEILGHAIDYLTDEFVHEGGSPGSDQGRLEAVLLLMAVNRAVYYECPEEPTLGERFRSLLGLNRHKRT